MKWLRYGALTLVGIVVLAVVVLWIWGMQQGATALTASVDIARTPQQIAPWLEEPEKLKQWVSWLKEVRTLTPPPNGVGTKTIWVMEDKNNNSKVMELNCEVIEFAPMHRVKVRIQTTEGFTGESEFVTTDLGNGHTRFDQIGTYKFDSAIIRLMLPLVIRSAASKALHDMETLKAKIEASPAN